LIAAVDNLRDSPEIKQYAAGLEDPTS